MSHKRSGLCGQIVAGGLADAVPMSLLPQKRIVLGGHGGSEKMRDRSRRELDGYAGADADSAFAAAIVGLPDRAADLIPAQPRILGSMMTAPMGQESAPACDG